jgi:hypothetical protein
MNSYVQNETCVGAVFGNEIMYKSPPISFSAAIVHTYLLSIFAA